jgi:dethiobiotin synthase
VVTAALAVALGELGVTVGVCKPAQTGVAPDEPGDIAEVVRLAGVTRTMELARYPDPLAPDTAARRCGMPPLRMTETLRAIGDFASEQDVTLIEGSGGLLVRLGEFTLVGLARELAAPVVVVTAASLGTLNHTELTTRALAEAGVACDGIVIGCAPAEPDLAAQCNVTDLPRVTGLPLIGSVPENAVALPAAQFATAAPDWFQRTHLTRFARR